MSNPGGGVEYDIIQHIATRTGDAFVFGSGFGYWFRVFHGTLGNFDDRSAFYLRKLIIERTIGLGGLLPESISEITVKSVFIFEVFSTLILPSLLVLSSVFSSFAVVFFCGSNGFLYLNFSLGDS